MRLAFSLFLLQRFCALLGVPVPAPTKGASADIKTLLVRALLSTNYWQPAPPLGDGTPAWKQEFPQMDRIPVKRGSVRYALQQVSNIVPFDV